LEGCLKVRLLKNGKHTTRVRNFELGIEIDLVIHRVDKTVEPFACVHVIKISLDFEGVVCA